jgi:sugar phosphate isomerase/epimerase
VSTELILFTDIMADDIEVAINRLRELEILTLDIRGSVYGRSIDDLDDARRERLASLLRDTRTTVHCLSTSLGAEDANAVGEHAFRTRLDEGIRNIVATLGIVEARMVRVFGCRYPPGHAPVEELAGSLPSWVYEAYREAAEALSSAGAVLTLENEPDSIISDPTAAVRFLSALGEPRIGFTWDVQNMWAAGTFPSAHVYEQLRALIDYVHLKGGRDSKSDPQGLVFRADLEHASWPVLEIVGQVLADGICPALCLNSSGGSIPDGYRHFADNDTQAMRISEAKADLEFLRRSFPELRRAGIR